MAAERSFLVRQLRRAGAAGQEIDELLDYCANPFELDRLDSSLELPMPDEPFVETWREWQRSAERDGAFLTLRRHLPELRFPIETGVSQWPSYRQATRHGVDPDHLPGASGLVVAEPGSISLEVEPSVAGAVPVITVRDRATFVSLVRALSRRNEPEPVPEALGGLMITGYVNWWRRRAGGESSEGAGGDRFMLLSDGPYSAVPATELGLEDAEWRRLSLELRRAHEASHNLMRRLLGAMRNNLFDELIAEFTGMRQAWGHFRDDWLLRFLGLEGPSGCRRAGRLDVYRGELSSGAFRALGELARRATRSLARFDLDLPAGPFEPVRLVAVVGALASERLETLASAEGAERLSENFVELEARLSSLPPSGVRNRPR